MGKIRLIALGLGLGLGLSLGQAAWRPLATAQNLSPTGLITKSSPHSVEETERRFLQVLDAKGLNVFATVDHAENAAGADLELAPTRVVIFGNPKAGTPLMRCQQSLGIDLPQKLLIWQDDQGVQIAYNDPRYLGGRHRLGGCGARVIDNISQALHGLTEQTVSP